MSDIQLFDIWLKAKNGFLYAVQSKKEGPWARSVVYIETVKKACPPCQVPVPVECMGKHEVSEFGVILTIQRKSLSMFYKPFV